MAEFANVIAVSYKVGAPAVDVVCSLLKGIDNAARNGGADFGIRVTLTYIDLNGSVQTLDSGRVAVKSTTLLSDIDNRTVAIQLTLQFGTTPTPGNTPSWSATAQLTNSDPSGNLIELGPAEQTFP